MTRRYSSVGKTAEWILPRDGGCLRLFLSDSPRKVEVHSELEADDPSSLESVAIALREAEEVSRLWMSGGKEPYSLNMPSAPNPGVRHFDPYAQLVRDALGFDPAETLAVAPCRCGATPLLMQIDSLPLADIWRYECDRCGTQGPSVSVGILVSMVGKTVEQSYAAMTWNQMLAGQPVTAAADGNDNQEVLGDSNG